MIFLIICKTDMSVDFWCKYVSISITPTLTSNFGKLLHDLVLSFALRDGPHKKTIVGNRDAYADVFARSNFVVVTLQEILQSEPKRLRWLWQGDQRQTVRTIAYKFDRFLRSLFSAESDEGVSSVQPAEGVHHQTQIPYRPSFLKQRDQLIFKQISWDLSHKNLWMFKRHHQTKISHNKTDNIIHFWWYSLCIQKPSVIWSRLQH